MAKGGLFLTINACLQALINSSTIKQPSIAQNTAIFMYLQYISMLNLYYFVLSMCVHLNAIVSCHKAEATTIY